MKNFYKYIVLFLLIQTVFVIQNYTHSQTNGKSITVQLNNKDTLISLQYFNTIPDTIQLWGCLGEFTYDSSNIKKDKYMLLISDEGFAMISINSKPIYLDKLSETKLSHKKLEQQYKGQGFEMTLTLKEKGEEYLVRHYSGILLLDDGKLKYIFKITGQFTC